MQLSDKRKALVGAVTGVLTVVANHIATGGSLQALLTGEALATSLVALGAAAIGYYLVYRVPNASKQEAK